MSHVRKLHLTGMAGEKKVIASYSWPLGQKQSIIEEHITAFKRAHSNVTVVITHCLEC